MNHGLDRSRLIEQRKALGLSQTEVAERMQMSQPAYARYESGSRTPSIHVIKTIADVLETSVDYLIGKNNSSLRSSISITKDDDSDFYTLVNTIYYSIDFSTSLTPVTSADSPSISTSISVV